MPRDWQALYASNRSAIRAARLPDPGLAAPGAPSGAPQPDRGLAVHVPAGLPAGVAVPLVCMLHGCSQDAAGFAAATRMNTLADRHGFVVVHPQQERGANQQGCWNWFDRAHQVRGRGEPARIAAIVGELAARGSRCRIDRRRIFVAGLSAGGAMAAVLAATYPDLFAAVAVHSGLPYGAAGSVPAAFEAMRRGAGDGVADGRAAHSAMGRHARVVPSLVIHGSADRTVAPVNAAGLLSQAMGANRLASPALRELDPSRPSSSSQGVAAGGLAYTEAEWTGPEGELLHGSLIVEGLGHAWSGGAPGGSFTDPRGPDASAAIWRFFDRVA